MIICSNRIERDTFVALLIDEAQDLSLRILEELRLLTNFETGQKKLLQIALIGQPELERKLGEPELWQLNQRVALGCRLVPLAANEVGSYIDSRLHAVAQQSTDLFDRDAVQKIGFYSTGIPRLINIICNNALLISDVAAKAKIDGKMIDEVAADLLLDQSGSGIGFAPPLVQRPSAQNDFLESGQEKNADRTAAESLFPTEYVVALTPGADSPAEYHNQKSLGWLTISPLLIVILIGLGGFLYSQKSNEIEYAQLSGAALQENSSNLQSELRIPISHNPQPSSAD